MDVFSRLGQKLGFQRSRPPGERFYLYILLFFMGYLIADSTTLYLRTFMLPSGSVGKFSTAKRVARRPIPSGSKLTEIKAKNIFNSDHIIGKTLRDQKTPEGKEPEDDDGKPTKTTLPLNLVGTIVSSTQERSVVTLQLTSKSEVRSYKVGEKVESIAEIKEILRNKVIFRNLNTRKLEFIENLEETKLKIGVTNRPRNKTVSAPAPPEKTEFTLSRAEVDKQLSNLSAILQDAKAVPYKSPGSDAVEGFKMVAIKSGSIYEKIGLKRGDVLKGVNGESVTSPQQAMELYQALKDSSNIKLKIIRGGSEKDLSYDIK